MVVSILETTTSSSSLIFVRLFFYPPLYTKRLSRFHGTSLHLRFSETILELSPHHLVDDSGVALDDFHNLGRDIFFDVVRHGDAVVAVGVHRDGGVDGLQKGLFVDAGDEEAGLVKRFGAFRAGADANCRERMPHAREEGTFFGAGNGCPTLVKKELSSGSVPLSLTTANAFICKQL